MPIVVVSLQRNVCCNTPGRRRLTDASCRRASSREKPGHHVCHARSNPAKTLWTTEYCIHDMFVLLRGLSTSASQVLFKYKACTPLGLAAGASQLLFKYKACALEGPVNQGISTSVSIPGLRLMLSLTEILLD